MWFGFFVIFRDYDGFVSIEGFFGFRRFVGFGLVFMRLWLSG